jgi:predicted transposase/invertase (TIGR01784 family)
MSTYDRLIEKGIGKGIEQGIEQKTIDVIRNCVKNDIKIPMISNITGLSEQRVIEIIKSLGL